MSLRQLTCFVVTAEERHLGRAAERLCLSQPPLTRHIQSLEEDLGAALFTRTSRGMTLTQAGEDLLHDARHVLGMVQRATDRVRRAARGQTGQIGMGLYGSATVGLVPSVLAAFRTGHSDVQVALHYAQTSAQIPALRQGKVLLAFERLQPVEPDIEVELVAREPLLLAVGVGHRLARCDAVDVGASRGERLIIGSSPTLAAATVDLCRRHGFEPMFAPAASDVIMSTALAAIGCGVSLVPASMARVQLPGIVYRPLNTEAEAWMELHCFYLRKPQPPLLQALLRSIRAFREASVHNHERSAGQAPRYAV